VKERNVANFMLKEPAYMPAAILLNTKTDIDKNTPAQYTVAVLCFA